jgi:hypothetical protein
VTEKRFKPPSPILLVVLAIAVPVGLAIGSATWAQHAGAGEGTIAAAAIASVCVYLGLMWSIPIGYSVVKILKQRRTGDYS